MADGANPEGDAPRPTGRAARDVRRAVFAKLNWSLSSSTEYTSSDSEAPESAPRDTLGDVPTFDSREGDEIHANADGIVVVCECDEETARRNSHMRPTGEWKRTLEFVKYHAARNDFILTLNLDSSKPIISMAQAVRLCNRRTGIGGDGVIVLTRDRNWQGNCRMWIFKADGTQPKMCANGIRCVVKFLAELERAKAPKSYTVLTRAGCMVPKLREDGQVCVDMGRPNLEAGDIPTKLATRGEVVRGTLVVDGNAWPVTCVSLGGPHCVTFRGMEGFDVDALPLEKIGPLFEHHEMFPARTNTEFVEVISRTGLKMRVWERGAGVTKACGIPACASVVAAVKEGRTERNCTVDVPGGRLEIEWRESDNHVYMTGPVERVFQGSIVLDS